MRLLCPSGWFGRCSVIGFAAAALWAGSASAAEPIRLNVVGGLANIAQYTEHEEPFWRDRIATLSGGRITASIRPFDRSGMRGQELLRYLELGVVGFGNVLLNAVIETEPVFGAIDLPALNPDIASLRRTTAAFRPHMSQMLRGRQGLELLAVYALPAQVLFCNRAFVGLGDLSGRRIRTAGVAQSEFVEALGAVPVITPFAEITSAVSTGVVDCAVTGSLSGNEIGLSRVTSHVHGMAVSWGVSLFLANGDAWDALPADIRDTLRREIGALERRIWDAADRDTARGFSCNTGTPDCVRGQRTRMTLVAADSDRDVRQRLLIDIVLPRWIDRCGTDCVEAWNQDIAAVVGIEAHRPRAEETARRPDR